MTALMVRTRTFTVLTSRLVPIVLLSALLSAVPFHAALAAAAPFLGSAASFAVLGGPAVTLTDSTISGNVGVRTGGAITLTRSTITGSTDFSADGAYADFLNAYGALAGEQCGTPPLTGTLSGVTLTPGVYCFDAAATLTGQLTLDAQGDPNAVWIFKIGTLGTGALTGTGFSVVMAGGGNPCNVYWWVAQAATLTASNFQGTILAGAAITVTGGTFNGDALAKAAVTLTGAELGGCGSQGGSVPPIQNNYGSIKVTGGGQISVPDPNSTGSATFGFNAQPDKKGGAKGNLNYVNHVTGLHVNGTVNDIVVITINPDGSPKTVLFFGTWDGGSFFVTVEDHGEPGTSDEFGITVITATGEQSEVTSQRVISNGNIQFHK
jgi:hypothetical protein